MVHRPHSIPQYPSKQTCGRAAGVAEVEALTGP